MMRGRSALALLVLMTLALLGSGCASLKDSVAALGNGNAAPAPPPTVRVEIDAPGDLRPLLERYLDLARLGGLSGSETVGDYELSRLIDAAPAQARELLQTEGYFDARVQVERLGLPAPGEPVRVKVAVTPGAPTLVGQVDIEVAGDLARGIDAGDPTAREVLAVLRGSWPLKTGTPFRNAAWSDAKAAALARLRAAGYANATWSGTAADIDAPRRAARLYLVADSGPLFRSGEIEVEGLKMHDRQTVLNLATFRRGAPVTEAMLLDYQDRLQKAGLFDRVSVTLDADPEQAAAARVIVRLSELSRHQVTVGTGISATSGPRITLEHVDRRFFGWPATVRNELEWGRARQAWDGELSTHPGEDQYRNLLGVTIERLKTDDDVVLSQRLRLGRTQESQRIERFYFVEYDRNARRTDASRTETTATTLNYHWVWRDIDNPLLPTEGLTLSLQTAAGRAGGSVSGGGTATGRGNFGRLYGRLTGYWPLGRQWYSQARIEVGQILGASSVIVPDTLAFRAGGDDSVRGHAYRSLGPVTEGAVGSGKVMLTASAEVARPILASMPSLWGAVFVDAGNAAVGWRQFEAVYGVGAGLRWRSPVGPLKLDWAYAPDLGRGRIHFSVGIVF